MEAATRGVSIKKVLLKILQNLQESAFCQSLFFHKNAGLRSGTGLSLLILRNF